MRSQIAGFQGCDFVPADVHGRELTRSSGLEDDTDDGDETGAPDENRPAAETIGGVGSEESTSETSSLESGHDVGLEVGSVVGGDMFVRELVQPVTRVSA